MKSNNRVFVIATMVLGLGTITHASANNSSIEDSLKHVIVTQSKQMTVNLTEQLQQSVKLTLKQMSDMHKPTLFIENQQGNVVAKNSIKIKDKSTAEEE